MAAFMSTTIIKLLPVLSRCCKLCCVLCAVQVLPVLMAGCTSEHADLRQCSVYGLGLLAAKVRSSLKDFSSAYEVTQQ